MIEVAKQIRRRTMTIVPIPLKNSSSVVEFFRQSGKVEIPRPGQCMYADVG